MRRAGIVVKDASLAVNCPDSRHEYDWDSDHQSARAFCVSKICEVSKQEIWKHARLAKASICLASVVFKPNSHVQSSPGRTKGNRPSRLVYILRRFSVRLRSYLLPRSLACLSDHCEIVLGRMCNDRLPREAITLGRRLR
jgi:hypothetical protein